MHSKKIFEKKNFQLTSLFIECESVFVLVKKNSKNFAHFVLESTGAPVENWVQKSKKLISGHPINYFCLPIVQTSYLRYKGT